jgi:hypothetical protein
LVFGFWVLKREIWFDGWFLDGFAAFSFATARSITTAKKHLNSGLPDGMFSSQKSQFG